MTSTNTNKEFIRQRVFNYAGQTIDLESDAEIVTVLRQKFDIRLPQRPSMQQSLMSTKSDHEIIGLILQYRALD